MGRPKVNAVMLRNLRPRGQIGFEDKILAWTSASKHPGLGLEDFGLELKILGGPNCSRRCLR